MNRTKNIAVYKKMLVAIILVIMLSNSIIVPRVQALSGGDLAKPIFQFIAWLGDIVMDFLQIRVGGMVEIGPDYNIQYSPGTIFSNKIALFDINFVKPNENYKQEYTDWTRISAVNSYWNTDDWEKYVAEYGFPEGTIEPEGTPKYEETIFVAAQGTR